MQEAGGRFWKIEHLFIVQKSGSQTCGAETACLGVAENERENLEEMAWAAHGMPLTCPCPSAPPLGSPLLGEEEGLSAGTISAGRCRQAAEARELAVQPWQGLLGEHHPEEVTQDQRQSVPGWVKDTGGTRELPRGTAARGQHTEQYSSYSPPPTLRVKKHAIPLNKLTSCLDVLQLYMFNFIG